MPANLTPQYLKAEEEYKRAKSATERLAGLRQMLVAIPKHKGTEKLQAELKHKISQAKQELEEGDKKAPKKGPSQRIPREGAGQVILVGAANAGKSQLLAALTNARPEVAAYPFTTHAAQPGMMAWEDVRVQLIDTPPITAEFLESWLPGMVRGADHALLVLDLADDAGLEQAEDAIARLAQTKTMLVGALPTDQSDEEVSYVPTLVAANKLDAPAAAERLEIARELLGDRFSIQEVSAAAGTHLETLRKRIYDALEVIRVYSKIPGRPADRERPFTVARGSTVHDVARLVHRDFVEGLKFARIWGAGVYEGQAVKRDHVLHDRDVVELHI